MKTFKNYTKLSELEPNASVFIPQNTIFTDIETTGLSSQKHFIYCIGISYIENDSLVIVQWFAENRQEEALILHEFVQFLQKGVEVIVTYNGKTFDLPFIEKRCQYHHLNLDLSSISHRDLLQEIRPLRHLLSLPRLRQKDIEIFLDIAREDLYDGGKLIEIYLEYEKNKDPDLLHLLWIHNYEDMKGMYRILPALSYKYLLDGMFDLVTFTCEEYIDFRGMPKQSLSRVPAKKENCFLKKSGYFLPGITSDKLCCFRADYRNKQSYMDLTDLWNSKDCAKPQDLSEELQQELHDLLVYRLNHFHKEKSNRKHMI